MNKYLTYFLFTILVFIGIFYIFFNNKLLEGNEEKPLTATDYKLLMMQAQIEEDEAAAQQKADKAEADRLSAEEAREAALLAQEEAHGKNRSGNISYDEIRNSYITALADKENEKYEDNLDLATQEKLNWDNAATDANVNVGDGQFVQSITENGETKWKCMDASPCYPNETPLFKCLPERDINLESRIYNFHRCKDTDWKYDTGYKASYDLKITNDKPGFKCRDRKNIQDCEHAAYTCIPYLQEEEDTATINYYINNNGWVLSDLDRSKYEGCDGKACVIL